ncbi:MAG: hypothetical protein AAGC70_12320 [Pseudomonadota bacterium]
MSATVAGCSGGVSLEGGVFDALGVSDKAIAESKREKKLKSRAGLVMPPSTERLPQPGSAPRPEQVAVTNTNERFPVNPEDVKRADLARKKAAHDAYCKKALDHARLMNRKDELIDGPMGRCNPSILEKLSGSNPLDNPNGTNPN